jgi:hypothetical protein
MSCLGQAHLELHPAPRLAVIERPGGTDKLYFHPRTEASRGNSQAVRDKRVMSFAILGGESSRDCAIWTRLGGRQKLTGVKANKSQQHDVGDHFAGLRKQIGRERDTCKSAADRKN